MVLRTSKGEEKMSRDKIGTIGNMAGEIYIRAMKLLPPDVKNALQKAYDAETSPQGKTMIKCMLESVKIAEEGDICICEDTGLQTYFLRIGSEFAKKIDLYKLDQAIRNGVALYSDEYHWRKTTIDPVTRKKPGTQSGFRHPVIYYDWLPDKDYMEAMCISHGSGSENQSFHSMLVPAQGVEGIKRFVIDSVYAAGGQPCNPGIWGIGLGGTFDSSARLAKEALIRPIGIYNPDPVIAELEKNLYDAINATGIGPMGLGGDVTCLAVHIETATTHETQNPVAMNGQCWCARRYGARIFSDGRVEYIWQFGGKAIE